MRVRDARGSSWAGAFLSFARRPDAGPSRAGRFRRQADSRAHAPEESPRSSIAVGGGKDTLMVRAKSKPRPMSRGAIPNQQARDGRHRRDLHEDLAILSTPQPTHVSSRLVRRRDAPRSCCVTSLVRASRRRRAHGKQQWRQGRVLPCRCVCAPPARVVRCSGSTVASRRTRLARSDARALSPIALRMQRNDRGVRSRGSRR